MVRRSQVIFAAVQSDSELELEELDQVDIGAQLDALELEGRPHIDKRRPRVPLAATRTEHRDEQQVLSQMMALRPSRHAQAFESAFGLHAEHVAKEGATESERLVGRARQSSTSMEKSRSVARTPKEYLCPKPPVGPSSTDYAKFSASNAPSCNKDGRKGRAGCAVRAESPVPPLDLTKVCGNLAEVKELPGGGIASDETASPLRKRLNLVDPIGDRSCTASDSASSAQHTRSDWCPSVRPEARSQPQHHVGITLPKASHANHRIPSSRSTPETTPERSGPRVIARSSYWHKEANRESFAVQEECAKDLAGVLAKNPTEIENTRQPSSVDRNVYLESHGLHADELDDVPMSWMLHAKEMQALTHVDQRLDDFAGDRSLLLTMRGAFDDLCRTVQDFRDKHQRPEEVCVYIQQLLLKCSVLDDERLLLELKRWLVGGPVPTPAAVDFVPCYKSCSCST